jgi:teichuronic acid biosynthesis glycosyltransferase TuaG
MSKHASDLVSVIMPCYKAEKTLEKSVNGVLGQTHTALELILVVDGLEDNTLGIAKSLAEKDPRVRVLSSSENRGVSRSRNLGIRLAKGEWVEDKLRHQLALAASERANLVCSAFYFFYPSTQKTLEVQTQKHINYNTLLHTNAIPLSTALYRTNLGGRQYFPTMPSPYIHEDYAFWLQMFQRFEMRVSNASTPSTYIAQVEGSRSANKWLSMRSHGYILRTVAGVNIFRCGWLLLSYFWHGASKRLQKRLIGKR